MAASFSATRPCVGIEQVVARAPAIAAEPRLTPASFRGGQGVRTMALDAMENPDKKHKA